MTSRETATAVERVLDFHCNICGAPGRRTYGELTREDPTCDACGSSVRIRAVIHLLSLALFGRSICLSRFPVDKSIVGLGLSDWEPYARRLAQRLDYRNTYFDRPPRLDITSIDDGEGTLDFLIATEVFEHVAPPVSRAFENAARLLKEDGVLIFTVPYDAEPVTDTVEHFPELHEYRIEEREGSPPVLINRTRQGETQRFDELVFHGGEGSTLEMRVFARHALVRDLAAAGFEHVSVMRRAAPEHGIVWHLPWSLPILASRSRPSREKRSQRSLGIRPRGAESAWQGSGDGAAAQPDAWAAVSGASPRGLRNRLIGRGRRVLVRLGSPNPLFDAAWYRDTYPDVPRDRLRAWLHWRRHGWREGRDPDPLFDTDWYLETYPDTRASGKDPLAHYLLHGSAEGRDPGPGFDARAYLERYPDVRASGLDPLLHYRRFGAREGRVVTPRQEGR